MIGCTWFYWQKLQSWRTFPILVLQPQHEIWRLLKFLTSFLYAADCLGMFRHRMFGVLMGSFSNWEDNIKPLFLRKCFGYIILLCRNWHRFWKSVWQTGTVRKRRRVTFLWRLLCVWARSKVAVLLASGLSELLQVYARGGRFFGRRFKMLMQTLGSWQQSVALSWLRSVSSASLLVL